MKSKDEEVKFPEIPNEDPPAQVLRQLTLELRHITNSMIGYATLLPDLHSDRQQKEIFDHILKIIQSLKVMFVQIDKYLDTCKPAAELQDEKFETDKTALLVFTIKFKRHFQPVETWINLLLQADINNEWEYKSGLAHIRQNAETLEALRKSAFNASSE